MSDDEEEHSLDRSHSSFRLLNGLTVFHFRDKIQPLFAASMVVLGGSFTDPVDFPGLNHLFEHMLFTGSKPFPGINEFSEFVNLNGGDTNASTHMDHIVFTMSVNNNFISALERFSQLFISPLFKLKAIENEITAMENEFELKRVIDDARLDQLKGYTSHKGHIFNRFSWGNRRSFSSHTTESIRDQLVKLFEKLCVGGSMYLVVSCQESFDKLHRLVTKLFSGIKHGSQHKLLANVSLKSPIWTSGQLIRFKALGDDHILQLVWINSPKSSDLFKPEVYLQQVLENRGEGSLLYFLREKGLVNSLQVITGNDNDDVGDYDSTSLGRLFTISLQLSGRGVKKIYKIIQMIFYFLKFLENNYSALVIDDYKKLQSLRIKSFFINGTGADTFSFVEWLAVNHLYYPEDDVLSGDFKIEADMKESIKTLLAHFCLSNVTLFLQTKSFKEDFKTMVEPWFNIQYRLEYIPYHWQNKLGNFADLNLDFKLPMKNKYIPVDSSDSSGDDSYDSSGGDSYDSSGGDSYHSSGGDSYDSSGDDSSDDDFEELNSSVMILKHWESDELPSFNFSVRFPMLPDVKSQAGFLLFEHLLKDSLDPITHEGLQGGIQSSLDFDHHKMMVCVSGCRETISIFVEDVWKHFQSYSPSPRDFEFQKQDFIAKCFFSTGEQVDNLMRESLCKGVHSHTSILDVLNKVKCNDMSQFINVLRSRMKIHVVSSGNMTLEEVRGISVVFNGFKPLDHHIASGFGLISIRDFVEKKENALIISDCNSCVKLIYQIGSKADAKTSACLLMLTEMIDTHTYNVLRTREGLGYDVRSCIENIRGVDHLAVKAVSSERNSTFLREKIISFAESLNVFLNRVGDADFIKYKKRAVDKLLHGAESFWQEVVVDRYKIDYTQTVREHLVALEKAELMSFYAENIKRSRRRLCLSICSLLQGDLLQGDLERPTKRLRIRF